MPRKQRIAENINVVRVKYIGPKKRKKQNSSAQENFIRQANVARTVYKNNEYPIKIRQKRQQSALVNGAEIRLNVPFSLAQRCVNIKRKDIKAQTQRQLNQLNREQNDPKWFFCWIQIRFNQTHKVPVKIEIYIYSIGEWE